MQAQIGIPVAIVFYVTSRCSVRRTSLTPQKILRKSKKACASLGFSLEDGGKICCRCWNERTVRNGWLKVASRRCSSNKRNRQGVPANSSNAYTHIKIEMVSLFFKTRLLISIHSCF